ncbi:hypothetical protein KC19_6G058400 [Ceratodon purpureus]|uniref:glycine--tRNA ligase n=1 Tax=Ceratodon purpureus TaxID=3225 RepID=A0A8T0HI30_CERPU|nr:hypothetical protein KC19_6G058400 [Ceratodon purpureus]
MGMMAAAAHTRLLMAPCNLRLFLASPALGRALAGGRIGGVSPVVVGSRHLRWRHAVAVGRKSGVVPERFVQCARSSVQAETAVHVENSDDVAAAGSLEQRNAPTFQQAIQRLQEYWASVGCVVMQSSNTEVGAGTMNPATFLRVLGPEPWNVAYVEPSVRPDDSRYGDNPNRVQRHTQFQVILKPDPGNSQELYLGSLAALGINTKAHDVRFVEDNWESPVLGAWGLGWEVWMDGMEITQFTYFQQCGSMPLLPVSVEITYGLERILMSLQGVDHFKKIQYAPGITYGELFLENEKEMSAFNLEHADVGRMQQLFEIYDAEARSLLSQGLPIPAYDHVLKTSHAFNVLDARGAIGVTERARYFGRMRTLARQCAQKWAESREQLGYPLGVWEEASHPEIIQQSSSQTDVPRTFVLEIGSEELPPQDVTSAVSQLESAIPSLLKLKRLQHASISVQGTPRRLVVMVDQLAMQQDNSEKEVRGPPAAKAFDADGNVTKAAEGFCKKNGVKKEDLYTKTDGKTEYVFAIVKEQGKPAVQVLAEEIPALLANLSFPKTMRWNSQASYSRPLRWLLALHGDTIVPFTYASVLSGRSSRVLRNSLQPTIQVAKAEDYLEATKEAGLVISMKERKESIWAQSSKLASSINGQIPDESKGGLLEEVANLVESPAPLLGSFDESFLKLPSDVLVTVMRKHQRYFPVVDQQNGQLLPAFITVANGQIDEAVVRKGNEAVLRARYEDAKFFYEADVSKPLVEYRPLLQGITFQEKLGSMLDKSKRVESMVEPLASALGLDGASLAAARQAAPLATADLATAMVKEFTSLAGIMGRHYALREGQPLPVADAIFETVLPRSAGDSLPKTDAGIVLAVADRLDSLVGLFAVGCQPSAAADPFGLRRSAYGLVQTLVANGKDLDLARALRLAADVQPLPVSDKVIEEVLIFITRRLEQLLVDGGANVVNVRSVLSERGTVPTLAARSVAQLETIASGEALNRVVAAYARPTRIVRGKNVDSSWKVNEALFTVPEENALWNAYKQAASLLHPGVDVNVFVEASEALVEPLEAFFNNVFVMAEEEDLRNNRLALLTSVANLPRGIADLSVLPGF